MSTASRTAQRALIGASATIRAVNLADLGAQQCTFGERAGEPVLLVCDQAGLHRFDLDGRAIDAPIALPFNGGEISAGADVAVVCRPFRAIVFDLVTATEIDRIESVRGAIVSRSGALLALSHGRPGELESLCVRDVREVGVNGYPPPVPTIARPLWIGDDSASDEGDWGLLYHVHDESIARYAYRSDESTSIVTRRHGQHRLAASSDGSVLGCAGSREVHFLSGVNGETLARGKSGTFAVGPGARIALAERKGLLRTIESGREEVVRVDAPYPWLAYSLDGRWLAWGGRGAFGVRVTR